MIWDRVVKAAIFNSIQIAKTSVQFINSASFLNIIREPGIAYLPAKPCLQTQMLKKTVSFIVFFHFRITNKERKKERKCLNQNPILA